MSFRDVSAAAVAPVRPLTRGVAPLSPAPEELPSIAVPNFGPLEVPTLDDTGPLDGMTLDHAIQQLMQANFELRSKFQEIPKAQADILSAGLRNNPLLFASADSLPYGAYSPQRPGADSYGVTVIQPFDVAHKRRNRLAVAALAKNVIHAQYQDAVRLELDQLYSTYLDALAAREAVRYATAGLAGMQAVTKTIESLLHGEEEALIALTRAEGQLEAARIALAQAKAAEAEAKEILAAQLALPGDAAMYLHLSGSVREVSVQVPPVEQLIGAAHQLRPDLVAYRFGVKRAQADVRLAQREAIPDVFVLYTPFGYSNNSPTGGRDAQSWGIGAFSSIPLFNRNQGNIARSTHVVSQASLEASAVERRIASEVRRAHLDYTAAKESVERFEGVVLPKLREYRDKKNRLLMQGQESPLSFFDAQREYNEVVRQYRDNLVRRRRAILKLNTVVGQRLFP